MATRPQYFDKEKQRPSKVATATTVEMTDDIAQAYWSDGKNVKFFDGIPMIVEVKADGSFYEVYNADGSPDIEGSHAKEQLDTQHTFEANFRTERDGYLAKCDIEINKALDNNLDTTELRQLRQDLRDATISWIIPDVSLLM